MKELAECLELGTEFKTHLLKIELIMEKFWETTIFHHYTDHGFNHSQRIITQLSALLEEYPELLNEQERFILLSSAYLHDVGMQSPEYAGLEKKDYTEYTPEEIETVRELHHISGSQMIVDSIKPGIGFDFGLGDCREYVSFISEVSKYHTGLVISELVDTWNRGEQVRRPMLAALLRLGDALDMDHRRVNMDVLSHWDIPVLSKFHWWAHHYVRSIHISRGKIGLIFRFPVKSRGTAVIDEFRKKVEDSLKKHFEEVYEILDGYGVRLFREPQTEDLVYEPEGVLEPIPEDLQVYLETQVKRLASIQEKTGVHFYFDGVPYSDDVKIAESGARLMGLLNEERYNAARVEVERCLTFELSPWQRLVVLNLAGKVYHVLGDINGSLQRSQDGLRISEREDLRNIYGNDFLQIRAAYLGNMSIVYHDKGELDKALTHRREALDIHREIGDRQGEATDLSNMGNVYYTKGEFDKALKHHQKALEINKEIGHRQGEGSNLGNMGPIYRDQGKLDKALTHHREALDIHREIGFRRGEAADLGNMGLIYSTKGELDKALTHHQKALEIHREIGFRLGEAGNLGNMGLVYHAKGELDKALTHHQKALEIHREIGFRLGEAGNLGNMGNVYHDKGEPDKALKQLQESLKIYREIGHRQGEAADLGNMGKMYHAKGELDKALKHHQKALEIHREIGFRLGEATDLGNMGLVYRDKGEFDKAVKNLEDALNILREIKSNLVELFENLLKQIKEESL